MEGVHCDLSLIFSGELFLFIYFFVFSRFLDLFRLSSLQSMVFCFSENAILELTE